MEGQAALIAKSGDYSKAAQIQEHAEQLKEIFRPEIDLYYDVMEATKNLCLQRNIGLIRSNLWTWGNGT